MSPSPDLSLAPPGGRCANEEVIRGRLESLGSLVGHTPLVKLNRLVDPGTMATVLVKMEQLNPGGSVKDRMAVNMVNRAEEAGLLQPGATGLWPAYVCTGLPYG